MRSILDKPVPHCVFEKIRFMIQIKIVIASGIEGIRLSILIFIFTTKGKDTAMKNNNMIDLHLNIPIVITCRPHA